VIERHNRYIDRIIIDKANKSLPPIRYIRVVILRLSDGSRKTIRPADFDCKSTAEFFETDYFRQYQERSNEVELVLDLRRVKDDLAITSTNIWKDGQETD
jgi:hypothetical protein